MRVALLWVSLLVVLVAPVCGADQHDQLKQAAAAREHLLAWQNQQPVPGNRHLHLVCWTPADRELPANYQERLTRIMKHIQAFYEREMERYGFESHSIGLQLEENDQLVLHVVGGLHDSSHYSKSSGHEIRKECVPTLKNAGIDLENETVLIMCNLATWDETQLRFSHNSPYYAGGSYQRGTAWQLDSPELDVPNLKLRQPIIFDGEYGKISLGKHNSIFIGGIAHELGHALGLPHCRARPDESVRGTALMGSGNRTYGDELRGEGRGSFITLAHALRLASHPQFSGSLKGIDQQARATLEDLSIEADQQAITVAGAVQGSPPVYAVIAYFDPAGGGDYDAVTATAVPDSNGRFTLRCNALAPGKAGQLRLFPLHANGSAGGQMSNTKFRYPYHVETNGTPDLSTYNTRKTLQPLLKALAQNDTQQAMQLAEELPAGKAASIAALLTNPSEPTKSPAEFADVTATVELTSLQHNSAKVGWSRPLLNRIPDSSALLEAGGQLFETGIYAHAPARHAYHLAGKWQSLQGKAGLAAGHNGSVQFECLGDGKSIWKSKVVRAGELVAFEINLENVDMLELVTHPTGDGPGSDWALWLEPVLTRASAD